MKKHGKLSQAHSRETRWTHTEELEIDTVGGFEREFVAEEFVFALP